MKKFFIRVKEGDTVLSLSERFNIPPASIISKNNLKKDPREGDMLIFEKEKEFIKYIVLPSDTKDVIEKKFSVNFEEILKNNGGVIYPFQTIYI